jgi:hypothetical protein
MASANQSETGERARVLALFRSGKSKSEIGKAIGRDKKQVARMLAEAIRGCGDGR